MNGAWELAIVMIVALSWVIYRYVAPKNWREWASASLIQAFIIALYAEMYGFPLTIYLLTRFKLDRQHMSTNLWSNLFGQGETAMVIAMIAGIPFIVIGLYLVVEGWREIYIASQEERLARDGLYGIIRHPQYTGIFLALFGEGILHWPTVFSVGLFPLIVFAYVRLAKREERQLAEKFRGEYHAYKKSVPMFFPRLRNLKDLFRIQIKHHRHGQ